MAEPLIALPSEEEMRQRLKRQNTSDIVVPWHNSLLEALGGNICTPEGIVTAFAGTIAQHFQGHAVGGMVVENVPSYIDALVDDVASRETVKNLWHQRLAAAAATPAVRRYDDAPTDWEKQQL